MTESELKIINPHGERFIASRILELNKTKIIGSGRSLTVDVPEYVARKAEKVASPARGRKPSDEILRESKEQALGILDDIMHEESFVTIDVQGKGRDFHWILMWFRTHLAYDSWARENIDDVMTNPIHENNGIRFVNLAEKPTNL